MELIAKHICEPTLVLFSRIGPYILTFKIIIDTATADYMIAKAPPVSSFMFNFEIFGKLSI
jgi:hypothetical protein